MLTAIEIRSQESGNGGGKMERNTWGKRVLLVLYLSNAV